MTKVLITLYVLTMSPDGKGWNEQGYRVHGADNSSAITACEILGERWLKNRVRNDKDKSSRYAFRCRYGPDKEFGI